MRSWVFLLFLLIAKSSFAENVLSIDAVPICKDGSYVVQDVDGDDQPETICMKQNGQKNEKGIVYGVFLNLTKRAESVQITVSLLTSMNKPVYPSDDYIESVNLNQYKSRKMKTPVSGSGIRLVHPEKSSVLYFWDKSKDELAKFWESD